ncbi:MAG: DUF779 domain-containing protein [Kribbellaceae bacterium]
MMPGIAATQAARRAIAALDARQYDALDHPRLVLEVAAGAAGGFSLDAGEGIHFVARDNLQEES